MLAMKWWMWGVAYSLMTFCAETREYYIRNQSSGSFSVEVSARDPRVTITPLIQSKIVDPLKICGVVEEEPGGKKSSIRREKRYEVVFNDGYVPPPGEEPFISFKNDDNEFKLVFFDENYAKLQSDTALEVYDEPLRREYDHRYTQDFNMQITSTCAIRHYISLASCLVVYCYERERFAIRCIEICDPPRNMTRVLNTKEGDENVAKFGDWHVPNPRDIGYLDQHYENLDSEKNAVETITEINPAWTHEEIRKHLNDFLFRKNEEVNAPSKNLSGGERAPAFRWRKLPLIRRNF
jgi:hypothetical protein